MTRITRLDPETRNTIAAGEVITRPAAVVRELVENSLDAGASSIDIAVDGGGIDEIEVRDDGHGMTAREVELAVERHTTSKLSSASDLERVETLGFRGEALSSIAAVARLSVTTNDGGPRGTRLTISDGDVETAPAGRAQGTTVTVRDLFHSVPARRAHLASAAAEFARISTLCSRYALCHPAVRFSLSHDGRKTFSTPGTSYTDALLGVYDRSVAGQSTTFSFVAGDGGREGESETRVEGVLCYPSVTRASRDHMYVGVNGRPLTDERLRDAVVDGYGSLLPKNRAPICAVSVTVSPGRVDHNVHPAKAEVAFRDEAVFDTVTQAVREALSTADLRRSGDVAMDLESTLEPASEQSRFDEIAVIGQFRDLYLLCAADDDLLVVDQHAAHERVNYERLQARVGELPTRTLDPPATLALSASEAAVVEARRDDLRELGYDVSAVGDGTVRVRSVPAPLGRSAAPSSLTDVLAGIDGASVDDVRDELLRDLACHPSLKAGDELTVEVAERLVTRLGSCDQPYACPHGRPTILSIAEETLARGFERDY